MILQKSSPPSECPPCVQGSQMPPCLRCVSGGQTMHSVAPGKWPWPSGQASATHTGELLEVCAPLGQAWQLFSTFSVSGAHAVQSWPSQMRPMGHRLSQEFQSLLTDCQLAQHTAPRPLRWFQFSSGLQGLIGSTWVITQVLPSRFGSQVSNPARPVLFMQALQLPYLSLAVFGGQVRQVKVGPWKRPGPVSTNLPSA